MPRKGVRESRPTIAPPEPTVPASTWQPPRLPRRVVTRSRLHERLDAGADAGLTLVVGPAGAGKSVVAAAWLATVDRPATWVALDETARDLPVFWRCLLTGVHHATGAELTDLLDRVETTTPTGAVDLWTAIVNRLTGLGPLVVVLDDLHAAASPAVNEALTWLLAHRPVELQLVICSRVNPAVPLHRLRAADDLVELRQADLRFSDPEAAELLRAAAEELTDADVDRLTAVTEGWAVGLALAAQSAARAAHPHEVAANFDGSATTVADYLVHEVLGVMPEELRDFVLTTSVLDVLEPRLCDHLVGRPGAAHHLQQLLDADLFVIEDEGPRPARRYHHLLRDVLLAQLEAMTPGRAEELHTRAADWYLAEGDIPRAIAHHLDAGQVEVAFSLIRDHALHFFDRGRHALVMSWASRIPPAFVADEPERLADLSLVMVGAEAYEEVHALALRAQHHLRPGPDGAHTRVLTHALLAFSEHILGEPAESMRMAEEAIVDAEASGVVEPALARLAPVTARQHAWADDPEGARRWIERALRIPSDGPFVTLVAVPAARCQLALTEGRLDDAESAARSVEASVRQLGSVAHTALVDVRIVLGVVAMERGVLHLAAEEMEAALADAPGRPVWGIRTRIELARLAIRRGDLAEAFDRCEQLRHVLPGRALPRGWGRWVDRVEIEAHLAAGVPARARRLLSRQPDGMETTLLLARTLAADGAGAEARDLLAGLDVEADTPRRRLGLRLAAAVAADGPAAACVELEGALVVAEEEGFVQVFLDLPAPRRALLPDLLRDRSDDLARTLHQRLRRAASEPRTVTGPSAALTDRELEVLALLPSLLTTDEIAERLYVSRNTVKSHLKSIYTKLDVTSRRAAVASATSAGLLRP